MTLVAVPFAENLVVSDFNIGVFLVIGAVFGAQVGVYLSPKFSPNFLRKAIAIILILMALNILFNSFNIII